MSKTESNLDAESLCILGVPVLRESQHDACRPEAIGPLGSIGRPAHPRLRCREIDGNDVTAIVDLLTEGFRTRKRRFWVAGLERLKQRAVPAGFPRYGYLLECNGAAVGVILLVFSSMTGSGETKVRCSVSSWYVKPEYRGYAAMLTSRALRHKGVTYYNITPRRETWPILQAQGYVQYCAGRFLAVPALSCRGAAEVRISEAEGSACADVPLWEIELLRAHFGYGCISLICRTEERSYPFVFLPTYRLSVLRRAYLAYCRQIGDFVRFAGAIGRYLFVKHGIFLVEVDANAPIDGLTGRYFDAAPKFFRGADPPRLGDIAYSERVLFGF